MKEEIYSLFDDDYYNKVKEIIKKFRQRTWNNTELTDEAKNKRLEQAKGQIKALQDGVKEKALNKLQEARESKEFKLPSMDKKTQQQEIERMNELNLIQSDIEAADSEKELIDIARSYEDNELLAKDVDRLVKNKFKQEGNKGAIIRLEGERNPDLSEIKRLEFTAEMLTNNKVIPIVVEEDQKYQFSYRNVNDLLKDKKDLQGVK